MCILYNSWNQKLAQGLSLFLNSMGPRQGSRLGVSGCVQSIGTERSFSEHEECLPRAMPIMSKDTTVRAGCHAKTGTMLHMVERTRSGLEAFR